MLITLKGWKWSNGQTISSKDLLFTMDEIAAAVKASPANWASYVPGFFPSTITSMSTPNANTLVVNMKKRGQPDLDGTGHPLRHHDHARRRVGEGFRERADPRLHQPGQRAEDLQLPHRAGQVGEHLRDEPALADRLRAVQADLVQRHHRRILLRAEPRVQRAARESPVQVRGSAVHLQRRSVQRDQERFGRRRSSSRRKTSRRSRR